MKKLIFLVLFTFFLLPFLQAEDIHLTTYYPSPSGLYDEMMVNKLVIGDTDTSSTSLPDTDGVLRFRGRGSNPSGLDDTEAGALYYNSSDGKFKYYDGSTWQTIAIE
ncbi:MAG: hypothetical protein K9L95_02085 [Candidatus Omnitrophica bacterium]|nr:hypothetical protein [Candidatus Omnitrophota bacterium]MCF7878244.1 hypothetical protein [Candidatus Omnitrophota bacterium]